MTRPAWHHPKGYRGVNERACLCFDQPRFKSSPHNRIKGLSQGSGDSLWRQRPYEGRGVAELPTRPAAKEPADLIRRRSTPPLRLVLHRAQATEIALLIDHSDGCVHAQRPDQLIFEIPIADVEIRFGYRVRWIEHSTGDEGLVHDTGLSGVTEP